MKLFVKILTLALCITLFSSCGIKDRMRQKAGEIGKDVKDTAGKITSDVTKKVDEITTEFTETKERVEKKIDDVTNAIDAVNKVFEEEDTPEEAPDAEVEGENLEDVE